MAPRASKSISALPAADEIRDDIVGLLQNLGDGVVFFDYEWRITYANEVARRISRMEPHHLNGPTHWEVYPETLGMPLETIYRRSMEERTSLEIEFYYPPFATWYALRTIPIATGLALHYRDTTRLKMAETMRDESALQLQQVFDVTSDAIFMLDRDYQFSFLNRRAKELLAPSGDVLGRNIWEAFPDSARADSPFHIAYRQAMEERTLKRFEAFYPAPQNQWFRVEARPAEGGLIVFFRDITEEREDAEALRLKTAEAERQAAEIETMYRTAPIGLALFDTEDFHYLRLNERQAAFFGLRPEQVVGKTLTETAPIPGLRELFESVRDGGSVVNFPLEGELVGRPGEYRYWTVNYSPVYATDGSVRAISAASLEVTQQKKAEKALIESEKLAAVGRLASSISHEINNPLESVTNLLYLIAMQTDLPNGVRTHVELAQSELARVSQIATQTLRFHRQASKPTPCTAAQLVEPVLDLYKGRLINSNILVDAKFATGQTVLCFENEIRQVLNNLIANAIDAMRRGGTLRVGADESVDAMTGVPGVTLTIADDGEGMSKEVQERIFEPFFTTKETHGTGLGLWISADIVQRHQGRIEVESRAAAESHGTTFRVFLPLKQNVAAEKAAGKT